MPLEAGHGKRNLPGGDAGSLYAVVETFIVNLLIGIIERWWLQVHFVYKTTAGCVSASRESVPGRQYAEL